jgi:alkylation response protein AidB-like acyl-CoA dehydrogenase
MDFRLTEDQQRIKDLARAFARGQFSELARRLEAQGEPMPVEDRKRLGEHGFLGINLPTQYGGLGLGQMEVILAIEEFSKVSQDIAFPILESIASIKVIEKYASEQLKRELIPRVCSGETMIGISMSEPDAGSALTDLTTRAVIGNDGVILNGRKRWCTGGGHSEGYLVYCRMSDEPGAKGIGAVYVERDRDGVSFGKRERFMGWRGNYTADIVLDDVRLPLDHVVLGAGGFPMLMQVFDLERCANAVSCLGIAAGALEDALEYVQQRKAFGRKLIEFQAVQLRFGEMVMQVEAARLLIYRAVMNGAEGYPSVLDSSVAKCFANEMVREVCGKAVQVMGAYGYSKAYPMEKRLRDSWGWGIAGGAIDIQKTNIAAAVTGRRFNQRRS